MNKFLVKIQNIFKILIIRLRPKVKSLIDVLVVMLSILTSFLSLYTILSIVYAFGFDVEYETIFNQKIYKYIYYTILLESIIVIVRGYIQKRSKNNKSKLYITIPLMVLGVIWLLPQKMLDSNIVLQLLNHNYLILLLTLVQSIVKMSAIITRSLTNRISPNQIFVGSFVMLIIIGMGLLLLPRATYSPLSIIDALFMSVSAICVTGLSTVDIPTTFTTTGQILILFLIQIGGIGIMTFTNFFGLIFTGKLSSRNSLMLKDLVTSNGDDRSTNIFATLRNILFITFLVEGIGVYMIYSAIPEGTPERLFIAVFDSVSAFCNAGISLIPNGLQNPAYTNNYMLLVMLSILIVMGGLGFPIVFNLWRWLKISVLNTYRRIFKHKRDYKKTPHVITSNTVIAITTTVILLVLGTVIFFLAEYDNLLAGKSLTGKIISSIFLAVTPRSAGFNTFNPGELAPISLLLLSLLMWIGASPMSTGGGIKTTTFGIAVLNIINTLRGRSTIEIRQRTIAQQTINRAFIIIFTSILIMAVSAMILLALEPQFSTRAVIFETLSAFSTVGISYGITPSLSLPSKILLIIIMFTGRIGPITLLGAFIKQKHRQFYTYPSEHIQIN